MYLPMFEHSPRKATAIMKELTSKPDLFVQLLSGSTWSRKPCSPSTTRSARGCHPCLRYVLFLGTSCYPCLRAGHAGHGSGGPLHCETHYFGSPVFLSTGSVIGLTHFDSPSNTVFSCTI
jgi:hypothetical protein